MGKKYKPGEAINLRLSKKHVNNTIMDAVNKASEENNLNKFMLEAIECYAKFNKFKEENAIDRKVVKVEFNDTETDFYSREDQPKGNVTRVISRKERVLEKRESQKKEIPKVEKKDTQIVTNDIEDEIFGDKHKNKGLNSAFASFRRNR